MPSFITSRSTSKPASHICHWCHLLKQFDLCSNHTHCTLKAFITTTGLFMWILPVGNGSPNHHALCCAVSLAFLSPHGYTAGRNVRVVWIMVMKMFYSLNFCDLCLIFFFLFEETSDLCNGSPFLPKKKKNKFRNQNKCAKSILWDTLLNCFSQSITIGSKKSGLSEKIFFRLKKKIFIVLPW